MNHQRLYDSADERHTPTPLALAVLNVISDLTADNLRQMTGRAHRSDPSPEVLVSRRRMHELVLALEATFPGATRNPEATADAWMRQASGGGRCSASLDLELDDPVSSRVRAEISQRIVNKIETSRLLCSLLPHSRGPHISIEGDGVYDSDYHAECFPLAVWSHERDDTPRFAAYEAAVTALAALSAPELRDREARNAMEHGRVLLGQGSNSKRRRLEQEAQQIQDARIRQALDGSDKL